MRTITITGDPTPAKDVVIVAPDEYAFVFAPNTMTFTVGSGYATTEEVTITSNGITLKRNCINRVCKFDLSVIFKSYFKLSQFPIVYGVTSGDPPVTDPEADDPFVVENVAVTVTAGTTTDDVDFYLRWGALQFDRPAIKAAYTFPFWTGYPSLVNTVREGQFEVDGPVVALGRTYGTSDKTVSFETLLFDTTESPAVLLQTVTYVYKQVCKLSILRTITQTKHCC
jgi:hypothetical protein